MKPIRVSYTLIAATANGVCASQTPSGAGALTLNGGLVSGGLVTLSVGQHVSVTSAGNDSGRTFTITGTNNYGAALSETITGANAGLASGTKNFKTITGVSVDAATAGAVTVGILGSAELNWIPLNHYLKDFKGSYFVDIGSPTNNFVNTGPITYQVETTVDDVQNPAITPVVNSIIGRSVSANDGFSFSGVATAIRVNVTLVTTGGSLVFTVTQGGLV